MSQEDHFLSSFKPATQLFKKHTEAGNTIRILTHNDADGISSGGIISIVALREGSPFRVSSEKKLDEKLVETLVEENPDLTVFCDFGSGYVDLLSEKMRSDVIILDHHLPQETKSDNIVHVNPLLHGIDGARNIAASGICYLFAKEVNPQNIDLAYLGIVGALGDQQDKGEQKSLTGLNTLIEKDAEEQHQLEKHVGMIFYGYETRPIPRAIAYTTTPYIPGLSGDESNSAAFLKKIGIPLKNGEDWRTLADLTEEEKRTLFSSLSNHMVSQGCDSSAVHQLLGTVYTFKLEEPSTTLRSGREFGTLLNACGRMGRQGVGLSICLGDRGDAMNEAQETLEEYRRKIGQSLDWVRQNSRIEELENIYLIRAEDNVEDTVIGVVSSILLSQGILKNRKPVIATAWNEDNQIKVSARGTEELTLRGLHMGMIMQTAAEELDGGGGGHDIAAGAYIPMEKEQEFIEKVNRLVKEQYTK